MNDSILKIINLHKHYRSGTEVLRVLQGINIEVYSGEFIAITGDSGSGKSTFLNVVATLDEDVTEGKIFFKGKELSPLSSNEKSRIRNISFGFIFQFHHLLTEFTALENVIIPGLIMGRSRSELHDQGKSLLTRVNLQDKLDMKPNQLSGGEQQRVAVARALINRPSVIFADEPTGNLDEKNSETVFKLLLELNRDFASTFILVTHNPDLALQSNRHFHLTAGNLVNKTRQEG
ncbi:MAG TPA: ABC transporter ATP-binding protein [Firmicutes bacterium]|nr:ABC transporter ATP-binding protein [Bacillota bacterium]